MSLLHQVQCLFACSHLINLHTLLETCLLVEPPVKLCCFSKTSIVLLNMISFRAIEFLLIFLLTLVSVKSSKFRHLKGEPLHKSHRIENICSLSNSVPGESDGLALNRTRCAISLQGPAGLVAVLEVNKFLSIPKIFIEN